MWDVKVTARWAPSYYRYDELVLFGTWLPVPGRLCVRYGILCIDGSITGHIDHYLEHGFQVLRWHRKFFFSYPYLKRALLTYVDKGLSGIFISKYYFFSTITLFRRSIPDISSCKLMGDDMFVAALFEIWGWKWRKQRNSIMHRQYFTLSSG